MLATLFVAATLFGGARTSEFALIAGMTGATLLLWLVRFWINPSHRFLLHPAVWPGLGFLGYAAWRATQAEVPYLARQELLLVVVAGVAFLLALHNLHGQDTTQAVVHGLAGLGCVIAGYAIIQALGQSQKVLWLAQPADYFKRAGGTFMNPNHLAAFLGLLVPLSVSQFLLGRGKAVIKVLHGYAALMMLGGIAVTMSRGGWIAVAVGLGGLLVWIGFRRRELRLPIAILALLMVGGGWFFYRTSEKARARVTNVAKADNRDAGQGRTWLWKPAVKMWADHRWLGVGPGHFDARFPQYRSPEVQLSPGWVHNEYLNLLTDYGVAGALLAAAAVGAFGWSAVRSVKYVERGSSDLGNRGSNRTAFFVGASSGLGTLALHCFVDFNLHIPAIAFAGAIISGLLASTLRFATERFWLTPRLAGRVLVTGAGIGTLVWLGPLASQLGREGVILNRSAAATAITPELLTNLDAAAALVPDNPRTAFELGENYRRLSFAGDDDWQKHGTQARVWLERATQLNPYDARARLRLAQTLSWIGERERAEKEFAEALRLGPNDVSVANGVAWFLLSNGRAAEAKPLLEASLKWKWWDNWAAVDYLQKAEQALKQP
jgi:O-antigen ligase